MAKFYVQSGTLKMIVQAADARRAALWAVHRAMNQVLPMDEDEVLFAPEEKSSDLDSLGTMVLGDSMQLSEQGFDRQDACQYTTFDVVSEWNQLMTALAKIESTLLDKVAAA